MGLPCSGIADPPPCAPGTDRQISPTGWASVSRAGVTQSQARAAYRWPNLVTTSPSSIVAAEGASMRSWTKALDLLETCFAPRAHVP